MIRGCAALKSVTYADRSYTLDDHGFLNPPEQWDENFAEGMARALGIPDGLTEKHWRVVRYLRHKFETEKTIPVIVMACAQNHMRLSELRSLFPTGYHRGACKIAGINYQFMYELNYWLTYETAPPKKTRYPLDQLGFLKNFELWDENFPEFIVNEMKMSTGPITEAHWEVINYLRDYYVQNNNIPVVYETCKANLIGLQDLLELFPSGYRRGACRIAGLPFYT
jgi:tRNA 2-thiouridine synthesizing protein E